MLEFLGTVEAGELPGGEVVVSAHGPLDERVATSLRDTLIPLTGARDAVSKLIVRWDDKLADSLAAENLFLDQSKDRRRATIGRLQSTVGVCRADAAAFDNVENALRGQWTMSCERGKLQVAITLAPTMPPRVQFLEVRPAPVTTPRANACVQ